MSDQDRSRSRSPMRRDEDDRPRSPPPADMADEQEQIKAFVGGIPWKMEDPDLKDLFREFDPLDAAVMRDKFSGKSRGFGFVYFRDEESRREAVEKIHDIEIDGRRISVREALPQGEAPRKRRGGPPRRDFDRYRGGDRRGGYDDRRNSRYDRGNDRGGDRLLQEDTTEETAAMIAGIEVLTVVMTVGMIDTEEDTNHDTNEAMGEAMTGMTDMHPTRSFGGVKL
eukprot:jgi/Picsp_1/6124/NSC_03478-R1_glycine-rich rna-binding protein 8